MSGSNGGGPLNSFALVAYLPAPLGSFIDGLRQELEPGCVAKAHVTILPPRLLACSPDSAWAQLLGTLEEMHPFRVELGGVKIFGRSDVVYLSIDRGNEELRQMHTKLDRGYCHLTPEVWDYCPHITLAQNSEANQIARKFQVASRRWREFPYSPSFRLEHVCFVQNTWGNRWRDLHEYDLSASPVLKR